MPADGLTVTPAQVTITDDDAPPTGVTLTLEPDVVGEGAGATGLVVAAALTGGDLRTVDTEVTLSVEGVSLTLDGGGATTAATAADFAADTVTLTIPAARPAARPLWRSPPWTTRLPRAMKLRRSPAPPKV